VVYLNTIENERKKSAFEEGHIALKILENGYISMKSLEGKINKLEVR
jgi:hypothetical protein